MDPEFRHDTELEGFWQVVDLVQIYHTAVKRELNFQADVLIRKLEPTTSLSRLVRKSYSSNLSESDFKATSSFKLILRDLPTALTWSYGTIIYQDMPIAQIANNSHPLRRFEQLTIELPSQIQFIDRYQKNEKEEYLFKPQAPKHVVQSYNGGQLYTFRNKKIQYLIPCFAIFKAYYNTSRGMYQSILSEYVLSAETKIIDQSKSRYADREAHVHIRSHLENSDAKWAARYFVGEHSKTASLILETCYKSSFIDQIETNTFKLCSAPPFFGEAKWTVNFFDFKQKNGTKTRFITDILSCGSDWGFDLCTFNRDNPGNKSTSDEDREVEKTNKKRNKPVASKPPSKEDSNATPDNNQLTFKIKASQMCTHQRAPHSIELSYPTKNDPLKKGVEVPFSPTRGKGNGGHGQGDKDVGRVHAETTLTERNLNLGELALLEMLAYIFSDIKVKQISVSTNTYSHDNRVFDLLPVPQKFQIEGARVPAFYFADKRKKFTRLISTVEIRVKRKFAYYIEVEKRLETPIGYVIVHSIMSDMPEVSREQIGNIHKAISANKSIALAETRRGKQSEGQTIEGLAYFRKKHTIFPTDLMLALTKMLEKLKSLGLETNEHITALSKAENIASGNLLSLQRYISSTKTE